MELELFTWDGWDGDPECMTFYNPRLKIDIGPWAMGRTFASAVISHHKDGYGVLQLYWNDAILAAEFKLHYKIGERIS